MSSDANEALLGLPSQQEILTHYYKYHRLARAASRSGNLMADIRVRLLVDAWLDWARATQKLAYALDAAEKVQEHVWHKARHQREVRKCLWDTEECTVDLVSALASWLAD